MSRTHELWRCEHCDRWIAAFAYDAHILRCDPTPKKSHRMMIVSRTRTQCIVCHCMEGSLTTECAGTIVTDGMREDVAESKIDFVGGKWVRKTVRD